jgi:hypothetical protein
VSASDSGGNFYERSRCPGPRVTTQCGLGSAVVDTTVAAPGPAIPCRRSAEGGPGVVDHAGKNKMTTLPADLPRNPSVGPPGLSIPDVTLPQLVFGEGHRYGAKQALIEVSSGR